MAELPDAPLRALAVPVDEARLLRNLQGVRQRQLQRRVRRARIGASLASLAACALVAILARTFWLPGRPTPGPLVATSGLSLARLGAAPRQLPAGMVALDDGSRIHLGQKARLELIENGGVRVRSLLHDGWARFEVKPGGPRRWIVEAGLAEVEVVGTAFTVARSRDETRVRVHHGRVLVRSAHLQGELLQLEAGQEVRVRASSPEHAQLRTTVANPSPAAQTASLALPTTGTAEQPATAPANTAASAALPSKVPGPARGTSAPSALARADALRAAGQAARAAEVLSRQLAVQPGAREAGLVALTLAQLQLDELHQPAQAAQSFALAAQSPGLLPALREQAAARQIEALARAGQLGSARVLAQDYVQRYPGGAWLGTLRIWLEGPQRSSP